MPAVDDATATPRGEAIEYVRRTAPAAWARAGGADHVMIGTHDLGVVA